MARLAALVFYLAVSATLVGCAAVGLPTVSSCFPREESARFLRLPIEEPWVGRLLLIGDFGTSHQGRNRSVAAAVQQYMHDASPLPSQVLLLGDNFYPRGLVGKDGRCGRPSDNGHHSAIRAQLEEVLGPYRWLREQAIPVHAIAGNHDHGCGAESLEHQREIDRFLPPEERWGHLWRFYSGLPEDITIDGLLQIVVLDSHAMISDPRVLRRATAELTDRLAAGRGQVAWQIVAAHHPLWSAGTHDGAWPDGLRRASSFVLFPAHFLAALYLPPFADLNQDAYTFRYRRYRSGVLRALEQSGATVPLVISGHDHSLQLLAPLGDDGPLQLIAGSGAYCSPVQWRPDLLFGAAQNGFAVLYYRPDALLVELYTVAPCLGSRSCATVTSPAPYRAFRWLRVRSPVQ